MHTISITHGFICRYKQKSLKMNLIWTYLVVGQGGKVQATRICWAELGRAECRSTVARGMSAPAAWGPAGTAGLSAACAECRGEPLLPPGTERQVRTTSYNKSSRSSSHTMTVFLPALYIYVSNKTLCIIISSIYLFLSYSLIVTRIGTRLSKQQ